MKHPVIFWDVDTQHDFMDPDGKLYVQGAELIKPKLEQLTFDNWLSAIRNGRSYVSDGRSHLMDFAADGVEVAQRGPGRRLPDGVGKPRACVHRFVSGRMGALPGGDRGRGEGAVAA